MTSHEEKVARAARKAIRATKNVEDAMREARAAGLSLRAIADAAGISYETVRRIVG